MRGGRLTEPRIITDFRQRTVAILPVGFYLDDVRWEKIWSFFDEKGDRVTMADLKRLFPDEPTVQNAVEDDGRTFGDLR